ncbi:MAG: c-type cytochrome [Myxococcales bacterium]|nr:MAG: c-type cytochrome [Myxococcales bacterium]
MKKMHWLGVIATSLITASTLAGCSGDDAPPVSAGGTGSGAGPATAGTGTSGSGTAGTGTGGTGAGGTGSSNVGVQLTGPAAYTLLTAAEAPAGAAAPAGYTAATTSCATCHGANGQGVDFLAPEIRHTPADFFKGVVRAGRKDHTGAPTGMTSFGMDKITDADLDAVSAWLIGLPKPTTGEGLYHSMCANCHGPKMPTGGGSPIKIQGASIANVDKFVRMGGSGTDVNDRLKYMPKYDTTLLTEEELGKIKMFIGAM